MRRALLSLATVWSATSCWNFDELEAAALCRNDAGPCAEADAGARAGGRPGTSGGAAGGASAGGLGGGSSTGGGGASGGTGGSTSGGNSGGSAGGVSGGSSGGASDEADGGNDDGGASGGASGGGAPPSITRRFTAGESAQTVGLAANDDFIVWLTISDDRCGVASASACMRFISSDGSLLIREFPETGRPIGVAAMTGYGVALVDDFGMTGYMRMPATDDAGFGLGPSSVMLSASGEAAVVGIGHGSFTIFPGESLAGAEITRFESNVIMFPCDDAGVEDAIAMKRGSEWEIIAAVSPSGFCGDSMVPGDETLVRIKLDGGFERAFSGSGKQSIRLAPRPDGFWYATFDGGYGLHRMSPDLLARLSDAGSAAVGGPFNFDVWSPSSAGNFELGDIVGAPDAAVYVVGTASALGGPLTAGRESLTFPSNRDVGILRYNTNGTTAGSFVFGQPGEKSVVSATWSHAQGLVVAGNCLSGASDGVCANDAGAWLGIVTGL